MYTAQLAIIAIAATIVTVNCLDPIRGPLDDKTDDTFQQDCLQSTNAYRSQHHAPGLTIDQSLVTYAKSRCQLISQYQDLQHGHAGLAGGTGENLAWAGSSAPGVGSCKSAIDEWYNEVQYYDYNTYQSTDPSKQIGHFTQLVWKSTTRVGCARCYGKGSQWYETYVVCDYQPPGNFVVNGDTAKAYGENVLKP
ncbi:Golgi-associated plant pathogenesis-related protein 1-like [Oppia nitens]|uniref:Golgi-associated plant pathogenesis-related protein 1-like n=1 Tax=Oppia nitens TaxID=1686743 RepID=UPI0023DBFD7A|nr:Golgi-associated plant pathogenesis-related protein 1-like [Oppia nitens]